MRYDVAVVGAGLAGLAAAAALACRGVRVAIVEARPPAPAPEPGRDFDIRVSTVSPVSLRILARLGAWQRLPGARHRPFEGMQVWDRAGFGEVRFEADSAGLPCLGHVVENRELEWALEAVCAKLDTVRWYRPAAVNAIDCSADMAVVHTDGARLEARLIVAADGARSVVRDLAGITARVVDYGQDAMVATVRTESCSEDAGVVTAWQRFLPTGPLALLPLPGGWSSVVWSTLPERAAALVQMPEQDFAQELASALEHRAGGVEVVRGRGRFPLLRVQASRYLSRRVVLIGDAAHTIHPLAGQGVNLGFLDAATLADVVWDQIGRGRDPGLVGNLRAYERSRRVHNEIIGDAMSVFHRAFTGTFPGLGWLRNTGFALVQRSDILKHLLVDYASGLTGDLPALARAGDGPWA